MAMLKPKLGDGPPLVTSPTFSPVLFITVAPCRAGGPTEKKNEIRYLYYIYTIK